MDERQNLIKTVHDGAALRELRLHQGYRQFADLLRGIYHENVLRLVEGENIDARAMLRAISELNDRLELKIALADDASEELKKDKFKTEWDTPA